jgi:ribonucleoside-diphosphate reductase beta chain
MTNNTIINLNKNIDFSKEPIFFGEKLNIQRYDNPKHGVFLKFFNEQVSAFWRPEEVTISNDRLDYEKMEDFEKFIFTKNLGYQILLDSVQSRGIHNLLENCSSPEVEVFCKSWEFFETIHSYSYTYIIQNIYPNAKEILDNIMLDEEILKRTTSVTKYYDSLINNIGDESLEELKKKLYLTLVSINILEGIRFYISFACSFSFAQNKKMEGNAKIISLIAGDENKHLGFTQKLINILKTEESEGFVEIAKECEPLVEQMFKDAAEEEMRWAEYLFKDGKHMLGLNKDILVQYMKFLTNQRMAAIKSKPCFEKTKNPITWMNHWLDNKSLQVAPQETEIESYVISSTKNDLESIDFDGFDLD